MVSKLRKFIEKEELLLANDKILLAVSGGMDSMCMLHIFSKLEYTIAVCHINHMLRGEESEQDALFVQKKCEELHIPFHLCKVDTQEKVDQLKGNLQEIAREIRYDHFDKLANTHLYTRIATAHNADDNAETFMMRAIDGAGLAGLKGIPIKNGKIIRPLIQCTRTEIEKFAQSHDISYRVDRSNQSLKYRRNQIRHQLMPTLLHIKSTAVQGLKTTIENIDDSQKLLAYLAQLHWDKFCAILPNGVIIDRDILKTPGVQSLLFLQFSKYGFNRNQIQQLLEHPKNYGNEFESQSHLLHVERAGFSIILKNEATIQKEIQISSIGAFQINHELKFIIEKVNTFALNSNPNEEFANTVCLSFPLKIRYWESGDQFQPIGMNGKTQSLQDYFVNQKIDKIKKSNIPLLVSQEKIIWIMGHRLSHLARISEEAKEVYKLSLVTLNP